MKEKRKRVAILFGGKSAEHDISIMSATAIYNNIDRNTFYAQLIYINRAGFWLPVSEDNLRQKQFPSQGYSSFVPWENRASQSLDEVDIFFPVLALPLPCLYISAATIYNKLNLQLKKTSPIRYLSNHAHWVHLLGYPK